MTPSRATTATSAIAAVFGLLTVCEVQADQSMVPPEGALSLAVEVTPDVPKPGDSGLTSVKDKGTLQESVAAYDQRLTTNARTTVRKAA
jgi:hypothetical protein